MIERLSLHMRLRALMTALMGGVLLVLVVLVYLLLQGSLLDDLDERLSDRATVLLTALEATDDLTRRTAFALPSPLTEFDAPGIYAQLLSADGTVQAASANLPDGARLAPPDLLTRARRESLVYGTFTAGGDEQVRLLVQAIAPTSAPLGEYLVVAESLEPTQRALAQTRTVLGISSATTLVLTWLGATLLTRRALAPVAHLTRTAQVVTATRDYRQRVAVPTPEDEIRQLSQTINELIATVEETLTQQRQFVADTSHELRSPLTVILANLDLLHRDLEPAERALSVEEARSEAQRMRRLVNDLLFLAQTDVAQGLAPVQVRLDSLVQEEVATIARQAPDHSLVVQVEPLGVRGDPERLAQLLRNLLTNATLHTPPGTTIRVGLRAAGGIAHLTVADDGLGIAATHLPHLWQRFYRVEKARSRASGGSGLGLAIVKHIAEAHRGQVQVSSQEGRGTIFEVFLPEVPR